MKLAFNCTFTHEGVSNVSIDRLWKAGILDAHNLMPKLLPDVITKVELLEGDGGAGTVKKFVFSEAVKEFRYIVDKTDALDDENHIIKQTVVEGGLIGSRLKSYSFELKLEAGSNGKTVEKTTVHYETLDDTPLSVEEQGQINASFSLMTKAVEEHLIANPAAYA
ncbi:major allergen Pru ar 1-like [Phalaenopsis equestris]|uniref:major allergen Pru ar 1-like n=1 Tax=Phalaenopsis equestris TaxID=78828 RepID=UPI0009E30416|nr:major allergen Pru ar 1-like [Phalaenopsis equestris]